MTDVERQRVEPSWIINELVAIAEEQGRTLEEVGVEAGMGRGTLYLWRRGVTARPSLDSVEKVARVLGYELELMLAPEALETDDVVH